MLAVRNFFLVVATTTAVCASAAQNKQRARNIFFGQSQKKSFVTALDQKQRLRICNAYPASTGFEISRGKTEKLTEGSSLQYKDCRDFHLRLRSGDKFDFKQGDAVIGTFSVSEVPQSSALLFLAIARHDRLSTAVSFQSHIFANLLNAQVAVVDTYKGDKVGKLQIQDTNGNGARSESLRYDSVVAVNPGHYQTVLTDSDGKVAAKRDLITANRESYVVLRVGVDAKDAGKSYPEELLVFPQTSSTFWRSSAASLNSFTAVVFAAFCSFAVMGVL